MCTSSSYSGFLKWLQLYPVGSSSYELIGNVSNIGALIVERGWLIINLGILSHIFDFSNKTSNSSTNFRDPNLYFYFILWRNAIKSALQSSGSPERIMLKFFISSSLTIEDRLLLTKFLKSYAVPCKYYYSIYLL